MSDHADERGGTDPGPIEPEAVGEATGADHQSIDPERRAAHRNLRSSEPGTPQPYVVHRAEIVAGGVDDPSSEELTQSHGRLPEVR